MDDAFWRLLFSTILLVIMVLLRPSANSQRLGLEAPRFSGVSASTSQLAVGRHIPVVCAFSSQVFAFTAD